MFDRRVWSAGVVACQSPDQQGVMSVSFGVSHVLWDVMQWRDDEQREEVWGRARGYRSW